MIQLIYSINSCLKTSCNYFYNIFFFKDGILGEILLHAIKRCIGPEAFNKKVRHGWKKIWSRVLTVVIPVAVRYELDLEKVLLHKGTPSGEFASPTATMSPLAQRITDEGLTGVRRAALMLGATFKER